MNKSGSLDNVTKFDDAVVCYITLSGG